MPEKVVYAASESLSGVGRFCNCNSDGCRGINRFHDPDDWRLVNRAEITSEGLRLGSGSQAISDYKAVSPGNLSLEVEPSGENHRVVFKKDFRPVISVNCGTENVTLNGVEVPHEGGEKCSLLIRLDWEKNRISGVEINLRILGIAYTQRISIIPSRNAAETSIHNITPGIQSPEHQAQILIRTRRNHRININRTPRLLGAVINLLRSIITLERGTFQVEILNLPLERLRL